MVFNVEKETAAGGVAAEERRVTGCRDWPVCFFLGLGLTYISGGDTYVIMRSPRLAGAGG